MAAAAAARRGGGARACKLEDDAAMDNCNTCGEGPRDMLESCLKQLKTSTSL